MENEDLIEHPHRWCRVVHRARTWVLRGGVLLVVASAAIAGDVLMLTFLAGAFAVGFGYGWWCLRSARRREEKKKPDSERPQEPHDFHVVLYARASWARVAVATDLLTPTLFGAGSLLYVVSLWSGLAGQFAVATVGWVVFGVALGLVSCWWEDWVHVRAVGWHIVGPDGSVVSAS